MTGSSRNALAAALAVALAGCSGCRKAEPPPPPPVEAARALAAIVATCADTFGAVEVRRTGQTTWEDVGAGTVFRVGDEVRTGARASARVAFLAGGGLELEEGADVVIDAAPPDPQAPGGAAPAPEPRVAVKDGVVRGFLPEGASSTAASDVRLVIALGDGKDVRLAPQGAEKTTFRLSSTGQGTEIALTGGNATVRSAGAERALRRGWATLAGAAGLGEAVELIAFPQSAEPGIDARIHLVPGLSVRLGWRPVAGASAYRVQIARDLSFQRPEKTVQLSATELTFTPKEPGMYAWRVASIDGARRQGEFGFARRMFLEEKPPRDLLVGPADGAVVRFTEALPLVTFTWASSGDAQPYRLVLASSPDLREARVESTLVTGQRAQVKIPRAGEYWWGVYQGAGAVDADPPPQPIFSRPRRFSVAKVAKPRMDVPRSITRWGD